MTRRTTTIIAIQFVEEREDTIPTTAEPVEDEPSRVVPRFRPIAKAAPRLADVVPLFGKRAAG